MTRFDEVTNILELLEDIAEIVDVEVACDEDIIIIEARFLNDKETEEVTKALPSILSEVLSGESGYEMEIDEDSIAILANCEDYNNDEEYECNEYVNFFINILKERLLEAFDDEMLYVILLDSMIEWVTRHIYERELREGISPSNAARTAIEWYDYINGVLASEEPEDWGDAVYEVVVTMARYLAEDAKEKFDEVVNLAEF